METIWALLAVIIGNKDLQEKAAGPIGSWLRAKLPDAEEKPLADFLRRVADKIAPA